MKKAAFSLVVVLSIFLIIPGCSTSKDDIQALTQENSNLQSQITELKQQNEKLKSQLDEIQNSAQNLLSQAQTYYDSRSYDKAKETISILIKKHPDSDDAKEAKQLLTLVDKEIKNEKQKVEQKIEADKKRLAEATQKMRKQYDEVQEITWYFDKNSPKYVNVNSLYLYMGSKRDSTPTLNLKIQYAADDWVFINKYIFKVDGKAYDIYTGDFGVTRDNNEGGIWELYDVELDQNNYEMIKAIISSKKTIIRHQGDEHYSDRVITSTEKQGLKNVLDAYEALGGKFVF